MAQDDDKFLIFLKSIESKSDEMSKMLINLDKKVDLHIQRTEFELNKINELDAVQNELLDQHIEGVNTLRKMYEDHERLDQTRFAKLDEPARLIKLLIKVIITTGAVVTALIAIGSFFKWF